jgi:hypothetical protein
MTKEEKQKAIDALKISAPVMGVTQEEFIDYIQTINKIMDWLEQEPCDVFDEYGNYKYPSDFELTEPNMATSMPYEDAISRQAVLDKKELVELEDGQSFYCISPEDVETLPPVNPTKRGHWLEHPEIETSTPEYLMFYECSECGDRQCFCKSDINKKRFCGNCGCRMVELQERSGEE